MRRITTTLTIALLTLMAGPTAAFAQESGTGQIHATEKVITEFGLGLIVAFPIFVWLMSRLQGGLEKRKDRKKAALRSSNHTSAWRGGW